MGDEEGSPRGRELIVNSEEELLTLQEEFLAQQRRPAASVTRVSHREGSGAAPGRTPGPAAGANGAGVAQLNRSGFIHNAGTTPSRSREPVSSGFDGRDGTGGGIGRPSINVREDEDLRIDNEEDLLRMQEEFIAQHSRPAAKVTRISRKGQAAPAATDGAAAGAAAAEAEVQAMGPLAAAAATTMDHAAVSGAAAANEEPRAGPPASRGGDAATGAVGAGTSVAKPRVTRADAAPVATARSAQGPPPRDQKPTSILGPIEGLLGDVVERPAPSLPPELPPPVPVVVRDVVTPFPETIPPHGVAATSTTFGIGRQAGPGAGAAPGYGGSFPEATHRRQSKFALSRKAKQDQDQQTGPQQASSTAGGTTGRSATATTVASGRPITARTLTDWSVLPSSAAASASATSTPHDAPVGNASGAACGGGSGGSGGGGGDAGTEELGAIREQNLQTVTHMRPEEVAEALEELSSRMTPEALDFLRRRGAQRLAKQQQELPQPPHPPASAAVVPGGPAAATPAPRPVASGRIARPAAELLGLSAAAAAGGRGGLGEREMASCANQEDGNALIDRVLRAVTTSGDVGRGGGGGARAAAGGGGASALSAAVAAPGNAVGSIPLGTLAAAQQRRQQQQQQEHIASLGAVSSGGADTTEAGLGTAEGSGGASSTRGSPADPRLVARLRFDVDGAVVDVQSPEEVFVEEEVLLRDQLRRDEGSAPPGYSLGELLVLCRSAVAAQRVAGLTTIADLAASARPRPEDLQLYAARDATAAAPGAPAGSPGADGSRTSGQMVRRYVPIPEHLRSRAPACCVSWQELWQFFVSELGLVAHLRLALDDMRPAVVTAAATALAAVLAASESELLAAEMADVCPSTGWPAATGGYLSRHGVTGSWEAAPPQPPAAAPRSGRAAAAGDDDEPDAPEAVALVDPLAGALQMGLLQRIRYLLMSRHVPGAVLPLLAVLCTAARSGSEAALAVAREPGLLAAVGSLLDPAAVAAAAAGPGASVVVAAAPGAAAGPAAQVAALMAVRVLCCASATTAHLVRSAGLLNHIQAYILLGGASGSSSSSSSSNGIGRSDTDQQAGGWGEGVVALQLLRLEALRTWRVCAHHGIALASLDDVYGSICHLLLPPPPPSASSASAPTEAAGADSVRQLTTAELYLLLATLTRHSFAVAQGDVTIGRSMLGPGPAAVIAAEALAWLRPGALAGVAAAAVMRCNLAIPLLSTAAAGSAAAAAAGASRGGLLRALLGAHPAVLLTPAAAHVACLAAVASFLASYWSTAAATPAAVFADVRCALAASGLLRTAASSSHDPQPVAATADTTMPLLPVMSAADMLAVAVLRWPSDDSTPSASASSCGPAGGGGSGRPGSPVGAALTGWALAAAGGEAVAAAAPAAEGTADGLRLGKLVQSCLQTAAASLLYGILQLTAAVHRDTPAAPAVAAGPLAVEVVRAAAPMCCQAAAAAPGLVGRVLCPWHAAALQHQLHLTRLLLLAGTLLPPRFHQTTLGTAAGNIVGGDDGGISDGGGGERGELQRVRLCVLEGCLAALSCSAPGAEGLCLQALRLALRASLVQPLLAAAHAAAARLAVVNPELALAAGGVPYTASDSSTTTAPFALPDAPPAAVDVAEVLFESYAASWLSLISQRRLTRPAGAATLPAAAGTSTSPLAEPVPAPPLPRIDPLELTPVSLQGQSGSRLPAPAQWAFMEAHRLPYPARRAQQPLVGGMGRQGAAASEAAQSVELHPVGCALLLCLGREAAGHGAGPGPRGGGALHGLSEGIKAQAALQAVYLFQAEEMVPQDADEGSEDSWRDPWVRWALAGLSHLYLFRHDGLQALPPGPPGPAWLPPALSERLIATLTSTCFGDPLLAAHLALALAREANPVVRLQVWNGLAMEKALHLLTPLSRCLGQAAQYLGSRSPRPDSEPEPDIAFLSAVQRALVEGDLDRALLPHTPATAPGSTPPSQSALAEGGRTEPRSAAPVSQGAAAAAVGGSANLAAAAGAVGCCSVAGDVALQLLTRYLLRRDGWPLLERAWKRGGQGAAAAKQHLRERAEAGAERAGADGEESDSSSSAGGKVGGGSGSAGAAMLAGLVRAARPELIAQLVLTAEVRWGVRREDVASVLAQTCSGDAALGERVRAVLVLCGLL